MSELFQLEGLRFSYGSNPVLEIDAFKLEQGSITAITGANGSGKTTLLNLLALLQLPDSGTLYYRDQPVTVENRRTLGRQLAYVQQKPYLLNLSVRENIELGLRFRKVAVAMRQEKTSRVMQALGIGHLADRAARTLSGGEVQKVAIARALVTDPEVLILDEPFTHLDRTAVVFFETLIEHLRGEGGKTIIFTSHDLLAAQLLADDIYSMVGGRLIPSTLTNLYTGKVNAGDHVFNTGRIDIHIPENISTGSHLTIDPGHLVLSKGRLESSMRNQFMGRIAAVQESRSQVQMSIEAGEKFHVIITHEALEDLDLHFGDSVWVSFKSSSVHVF